MQTLHKSLAQPDARAEIIARVHGVRPDNVARFGVMNAREMIVHCVVCLEAGLGHRSVSPRESFIGRTLIKYVALYAPMHWPSGVKTLPEMDVRRNGDRPGEFVSDVARLVQLVEEFSARGSNEAWPRHPIFGAMNELEWKRWAYLHTDHHLRQFSA